MNLYKINEQHEKLLDAIASGDIPEEAIEDTLAGLEGDFASKADSVACFIKQLLSDAESIKAESDTLAKRAKFKKNAADRMIKSLYSQLKRFGKDNLETTRNVLKIKKNPPHVEVDDEENFVKWAEKSGYDDLLKYDSPKIKKAELQQAIKDGAQIPGVRLVQDEKLTIK